MDTPRLHHAERKTNSGGETKIENNKDSENDSD